MPTWRLVNPSDTFKWPIKGSLQHSMKVEYTVFGDENGLFTSPEGASEIPFGTKYIWQGGHENTTDDPAIRDLWLAYGYEVQDWIDPLSLFMSDNLFPSESLFPGKLA